MVIDHDPLAVVSVDIHGWHFRDCANTAKHSKEVASLMPALSIALALLQAILLAFFSSLQPLAMNPLNPKKLLLSKWTAVKPVAKQKHFLVSRVIQPELETDPVELVEIEAIFSKATQIIRWRELQDDGLWRQGWV
jgi:tryptophan-rich hypothetical protein